MQVQNRVFYCLTLLFYFRTFVPKPVPHIRLFYWTTISSHRY